MVTRCVNYHYYNGKQCDQCRLKYERKNPKSFDFLTEYQKENLREHCKNVLKEEGIK